MPTMLESVLRSAGLESLIPWAYEQFQDGVSEDELILRLEERQEYRQRFRAVFEIRRRIAEEGPGSNLVPVSARDVLAYEQQFASLRSFYGLPDIADPQELMVGDVSLRELETRFAAAAADVEAARADPVYAAALQELELLGLGEGDLIAYWADPDLTQPEIERKRLAARTLAAANRNQFALSEDEALRYGQRIEDPEAAFGELARAGELTTPLDSGETQIGRTELLEAAAGNAAAQRTLADRARRRSAVFGQAGGFATNREGISGVG